MPVRRQRRRIGVLAERRDKVLQAFYAKEIGVEQLNELVRTVLEARERSP